MQRTPIENTKETLRQCDSAEGAVSRLESRSLVLRPRVPLAEVEGPGSASVKWGGSTGSHSGEEGDVPRAGDAAGGVASLGERGGLVPCGGGALVPGSVRPEILPAAWPLEVAQAPVSWQNPLIHGPSVSCCLRPPSPAGVVGWVWEPGGIGPPNGELPGHCGGGPERTLGILRFRAALTHCAAGRRRRCSLQRVEHGISFCLITERLCPFVCLFYLFV